MRAASVVACSDLNALETEVFDLCLAIIIGDSDTSAVQFADHHLGRGLRQAYRVFQRILKDLNDHIGHPHAAGMVQPCLRFVRRIGHDHDIPAFLLQVIDSGVFFSVVQKKDIFPDDRAPPILPRTVHGEVNRVRYIFFHLILL